MQVLLNPQKLVTTKINESTLYEQSYSKQAFTGVRLKFKHT